MEENYIEEDIDEIYYDEFDPENLVCEEPEVKTPVSVGTKGEKGSEYVVVKLNYRYPSGSGFIKKPFKVIGCEMTSDQGIQIKDTNYGKEYSILSRINHTSEEGKAFYDFSKVLDRTVVEFYKKNWKKCDVDEDIDVNRPGKAVTKVLYVKPGDDAYQPSTYLKFFYYPKSGYKTKILIPPEFEGGSVKELDWDEAKNCKLKFIPCINYYRCNNAGKGGFKVQNLCVSIVITSIEKNSNLISQKRTLQLIGSSRGQQIAAQVASLKKQDQQKYLPIHEESDDNPEMSTFDDLKNEEATDEEHVEEQSDAEMEPIKPPLVKVAGVAASKNSSIKNLISGVKPRN